MKLDTYSVTITQEDLQGRDQIWIDLGVGQGKIHLSLHKRNFRITSWLDRTWSRLQTKMYRLGN